MATKTPREFHCRLISLSILICAQAAAVGGTITALALRFPWFLLLFCLLSAGVIVRIMAKEEHPSYKLAWIAAILALPLLGGLLYLAWGNKGIPRGERRRLVRCILDNPSLFSPVRGESEALTEADPAAAVPAEYVLRISGFPPLGGTLVSYCPLGEDLLRMMLGELPRARRFILLEYFIIQEGRMWGAILNVLREKAAQGVEVLVLFDDLGCLRTLPASYQASLQRDGIRCAVFNPLHPSLSALLNYRDHRKICVIDGGTGFCGGINLADEYINVIPKHGHWKDTAVMLRGRAVESLTRMFFQNWSSVPGVPREDYSRFFPKVRPYLAPGWVQPFADSPLDRYNVAENLYLQMICRATRYIYITTPYLILDHEMSAALCIAAESGVDVRIVTPHIPDKKPVHMVTRSYYQSLVASGVRIYEYRPGFIHSKMFVSDDKMAVVGTANLDYRSLYLHYECGVALYHVPVIEEIRDDILDTISSSIPITPASLSSLPLITRLAASFLRFFSPLM